jgi:N-acetylneuraminate synthase
MKIGHYEVGTGHRPFIVAEMSGNHNHSLERALQIVEEAAKAGVHGLKLQTYTADTMTIDMSHGEFSIEDPNSLWKGETLYNLYKQAYTPWEWHKPIFERCRQLGLIGFSSPFDKTAVEFLEELDVPCYKIASFENTDIQLIRKVASTGKPIIISTGMASVAEIDDAVREVRNQGNNNVILLKCTSTYPATPTNTNLATIPHLRELFGCEVGLSDHTMGIGVSVASIAMGATLIEKHFTLSRADGGVDSAFSMEPHEMKALVEETERAWESIGQIRYGASAAESQSLLHRRSLYVVEPLKAGDVITEHNVRAIRPGLGLSTKFYDVVLGKKVKADIPRGTPLTWELI